MNEILLEKLLTSPYSEWIILVSAVMFTVGAFSYITKQLSLPLNQQALIGIFRRARNTIKGMIKASSVEDYQPKLRTLKISKWSYVVICCFFAGVMYLYGTAVIALSTTIKSGDFKPILALFFGVSLIFMGNMYRVFAHNIRKDI